jgi:hypothetical protein
MKTVYTTCLILTVALFCSFQLADDKASKAEIELGKQINDYRKSLQLPEIPISNKLTKVAKIHCRDLYDYYVKGNSNCNEHSWSDKGNWTPVCYTSNPDQKQTLGMWNKPKEIANYASYGFEIEHSHSPKDDMCNPICALTGWKNSSPHNAVMTNQGVWQKMNWKAMGIGLYKGYACVWFGDLADK